MKDEIKYTCDCGKSFETQTKLSHHKTHCKVFQQNKKLKEQEDREKRRLPNGMFKCENPDCGKEHDGKFGSGRFCCKTCRSHYNGIVSAKTAIANGNKHCPANFRRKNAPYGTWKCKICGKVFKTRNSKNQHTKKFHPELRPGRIIGHAWNHGLTKENCAIIAAAVPKIQKAVKQAIVEGRCSGRGSTPEKEALRRKRMSIAALNRTTPSVCKRTEPYIKKDGSTVNLDSSYERTIAKILDEHDIEWIRLKPLDWYSKDGVKHHYFPDFYLTKYDIYLDPKNDYCFKVQAEKISYVKEHYANCIFMTKDQLTWEYLEKILESQSSPVTTPHC